MFLRLKSVSIILLFVLSACDEPVPKSTPAEITQDTLAVVSPEPPVVLKKSTPIDYDSSEWTELIRLDETVLLDMRYATENNFVKEQLYDCERCFLRPEAAEAIVKINQQLQIKGYRLKMFDCFRPLPIQQKLWDKFQNPSYVTPPSKGSMHNRGLAVDLTIVDTGGEELDMGTEFDFFGKEAHHTYTGHSEIVQQNRLLLKETMETFGFKGIRTEWWHYSYTQKRYKLSEMLWKCEVD